MTDFRALLGDLRRPRLLIRAARFGVSQYRRDRDLRRLIGGACASAIALPQLMREEAQLEATRLSGDSGYSVARHVEVLIALISEAQFLPLLIPA